MVLASLRRSLHHTASHKLVIGDRSTINSTAQEEMIQIGNQPTPVEPIRPFPQIPRKVLRADAMIRSIQPCFHIAEQFMNDRHVHPSILTRPLNDRNVFVSYQICISMEAI